ncbi:MAG: glutaminyl-tRNA synthase (glutamine-hydrolyzing) subunit A [Candidatus Taylorbacteria bacterium RIFCSPHIGHO2_01_FULL_51_15]|uniref:Glutamyl-tRNA(Gln) amidotransferase subunit A n=1 Tax=Candidatus Taylorbacteria bacterium RIFCSPHIGHO2_01_FULL_51_15 TaxID=1802304 RepID=A0A1G2MCB8_9BACT|nr:MAG: glutaminyl-tRNA synthase (glutamine-hydrolyzing) subunit A [Candidatus Taylorbacteria bacterium RIFCSPHIGHO2_01_FULL_51_15]
MDLQTLSISKAHSALVKGEYSAVELAEAYLSEIKKKNEALNAYLEVFDDVIEQAKAADARIKKGEATMLTGIPLAVKDNILIKGKRVGSASKILENYVASYDATAIAKLKEAGAVFLGRANMDEFALGGSTENSAYGVTKNPHDTTRVPGGTSGGSAAAVGANLALAALGSDTGGSIRQPASFCGVVGLKPTYGAVSRHGLMAAVSSFDQIGPIAKTVEDAEIIFNCIKGQDIFDSTSMEIQNMKHGTWNIKKITIGIPKTFTEMEGISLEVSKNFQESLAHLKKSGFVIKDIELPNVRYSLPAYYIINFAEVSTNLARFDGVKYGFHMAGKNLLEDYRNTRGLGFGPEARRRILLGSYVLSSGYYDAYYNKANQVREIIRADFAKAFSEVDVIATPTTPTVAFKIGEKSNNPLSMYLADIFTTAANLGGIPAISIPSGFAKREGKELPLGLQLMGAYGHDQTLFDVGKAFQAVA